MTCQQNMHVLVLNFFFLPSFSFFLSVWRNCFSPQSPKSSIWKCSFNVNMKPFSLQAVGTPLMLHQRQALSWMCARENKSSLPPFWEKRGELYYNSLTCFSAKEIPERVRGGILADDMGLVSNTHTHIWLHTSSHCCDLSRHESTPKLLFVFSRVRLWQPLLWSSPTFTKESLCPWKDV